MIRYFYLAMICLFSFSVMGQKIDNKTKGYTWYNDGEIVAPLSLMAMGILTYLQPVKRAVQSSTIGYRDRFVNVEDYLQFGPLILQATANILKLKGRSDIKGQLKYLFISELSTLSLVYVLKTSINETRPNGGKWSFPSGHTAQGFVSATILYQQYKNSHPILAYSGYSMALATGLLRIVHDKHWVNDVLFSAGLGILVPNLVHRIRRVKRNNQIHTWFSGNRIGLTYAL